MGPPFGGQASESLKGKGVTLRTLGASSPVPKGKRGGGGYYEGGHYPTDPINGGGGEGAGILLYPLGQKYSLLNKVFMSRFELVFTKIAARLDSTDK